MIVYERINASGGVFGNRIEIIETPYHPDIYGPKGRSRVDHFHIYPSSGLITGPKRRHYEIAVSTPDGALTHGDESHPISVILPENQMITFRRRISKRSLEQWGESMDAGFRVHRAPLPISFLPTIEHDTTT